MKATISICLLSTALLSAQETALQLDPAQTHVAFTLSDVLHTVHGTFQLKRGSVDYDFESGKASGEVVIDAKSGNSGNETRDRKMHKSILESDLYPEIDFLPDHVEGDLKSAKVHGIFRIHGADHEVTLTIVAAPENGQLNLTIHFPVPYVAWGMKNPSTLFLRVGDTVNIDVAAVGHIMRP